MLRHIWRNNKNGCNEIELKRGHSGKLRRTSGLMDFSLKEMSKEFAAILNPGPSKHGNEYRPPLQTHYEGEFMQ
jgi:hypothetical protein